MYVALVPDDFFLLVALCKVDVKQTVNNRKKTQGVCAS